MAKDKRKKLSTDTGFMLSDKEKFKNIIAQRKAAKKFKMFKGAKKGIMTKEEYELRRKNILSRRKKK